MKQSESEDSIVYKFLYLIILLFLVYQLYFNTLLTNFLYQPNLLDSKNHIIQKYIVCLNFDEIVLNNINILNVLDFFLFLLLLLSILKPKSRIFSFINLLIGTIYYMFYHIGIGHHDHVLVGYWLILLLLCFKSPDNFKIGYELIRYYCCLIFGTAGIWKMVNGAFFDKYHIKNMIFFEYRHLLASNPDYWMLKFYYGFANSNFSVFVWYLACILEFTFLIGFLTKKMDNLLILLIFAFITTNFFLFHIQFWPYFLFIPFFINYTTLLYHLHSIKRNIHSIYFKLI